MLLDGPFQAWPYGPVLSTVEAQFRSFGSAPIQRYAKDAEGRSWRVDEAASPAMARTLNEVWCAARDRSARDLSVITQMPGSAWWNAWQQGARHISDADMQTDQTYLEPLGLVEATVGFEPTISGL